MRRPHFIAWLAVSLSAPAAAQVADGVYLGDGAGPRLISVPFAPEVVMVKNGGPTLQPAVVKLATMPDGGSKELTLGSGGPVVADELVSLTSAGFVVGSAAPVNEPGAPHYWLALGAGSGVVTGSYAGDGAAMHAVSSGFQPDLVLIAPRSTARVSFTLSAAPVGMTFAFDGQTGMPYDWISSLTPTGFVVTNAPEVNGPGTVFDWAAMRSAPGELQVGAYVGDGVADRQVGGMPFSPQWVMVKGRTQNGMMQPGARDDVSELGVTNASPAGGSIRLTADGFALPTAPRVNGAGQPFVYLAFGGTTYLADGGVKTGDGGTGGTGGAGGAGGAGGGTAYLGPHHYTVGCDCGHGGGLAPWAFILLAVAGFSSRSRCACATTRPSRTTPPTR